MLRTWIVVASFVSMTGCILGINPDYDGPSTTRAEGSETASSADSKASESGSDTHASETDEAGAETDEAGTETDESDTETDESDTETMPGTVEVPASFSACRGPNFSPAQCAFEAGEGGHEAVAIDNENDRGSFTAACMIFTLDDALADKTVTAVVLEVHTIPENWAGSSTSGEIWESEPFSAESLDDSLPATVGAMLAPNPGPSFVFSPIEWTLPVDVVSANTELYLCAYPASSDGVYFFSHEGPIPPLLVIDYE